MSVENEVHFTSECNRYCYILLVMAAGMLRLQDPVRHMCSWDETDSFWHFERRTMTAERTLSLLLE